MNELKTLTRLISYRMTKSRSILDVIGLSSLSQAKKETLIQMTILSVACILGMKGIYSSEQYFSNEFDWDWNYLWFSKFWRFNSFYFSVLCEVVLCAALRKCHPRIWSVSQFFPQFFPNLLNKSLNVWFRIMISSSFLT